jgi:hypothetical protein
MEDRAFNHRVSSECVLNEHVIGLIKRFKIVSDCYRNSANALAYDSALSQASATTSRKHKLCKKSNGLKSLLKIVCLAI